MSKILTLFRPLFIAAAHCWRLMLDEFEKLEYAAHMKVFAEAEQAKAKAEAEKVRITAEAKAAAEKAGLSLIHPLKLQAMEASAKKVESLVAAAGAAVVADVKADPIKAVTEVAGAVAALA